MMMSGPPIGPGRAAPDAEAVIAALLEHHTGQRLSRDRSWRIGTALLPLLRAHGLTDLDALVHRLLQPGQRALLDDAIDAMVNTESRFFRDTPVFDAIRDILLAARPSGRPLRLWSAGCGRGQEPLSLAMLLAESAPAGSAPAESTTAEPAIAEPAIAEPESAAALALSAAIIDATDISLGAIAAARAGHFTDFEASRGLSPARRARFFRADADGWRALPGLLAPIRFVHANLLD